MVNAPCLDCKFRKLHCHTICEEYKDYRSTRELIKKKKSEEIMMNLYIESTIQRFSGKVIGER